MSETTKKPRATAYFAFADFETTQGENTSVALWGFHLYAYYRSLNEFKLIGYYEGVDVESFMKLQFSFKRKIKTYFHNLSNFDGFFIFKKLESIGYSPLAVKTLRTELKIKNKCKLRLKKDEDVTDYKNKYNILFSENKKTLCIKVYGGEKSGRSQYYTKLEFNCSLLLFPRMSIARMGEIVGLPKLVNTVDFSSIKNFSDLNHVPPHLRLYMERDCAILSTYMIRFFKKRGINGIKITSASTAYHEFRNCLWNEKMFNFLDIEVDGNPKDGYAVNGKVLKTRKKHVLSQRYVMKKLFPTKWIKDYPELREAYSGGIGYVNPDYSCMTFKNVISFDINSSYPAVMKQGMFPWGEPLYNKPNNKDYPLKIYEVTVTTKVRNKTGLPFIPTNIDKSQNNKKVNFYGKVFERKVIYLTNFEYERFKEYYKGKHEAHPLFQFKAISGDLLFGPYIDKWYDVKKNAKDPIEKFGAKIYLNSLYGKFGTKSHRKVHYYSKMFQDSWHCEDVVTEDKFYLPVGIFITSLARMKLVDAVGHNVDKMLYCDTDSLYLVGRYLKYFDFKISNKLGDWKQELGGSPATFRRVKAYTTGENTKFSGCTLRDRILKHTEVIKGFAIEQLQGRQVNSKEGKYLTEIIKRTKPVWDDRAQKDMWYYGMSKTQFIAKYKSKLTDDMVDLSNSFKDV